MKRQLSAKSTTIKQLSQQNNSNRIQFSSKYSNKNTPRNGLSIRSLNCSPQCVKSKSKIIRLDVGLLIKQAKIKKMQTPRCINSEQTKTSDSRESKKTYSISKISNRWGSKTQKIINPFIQFDNYSNQIKPFILNKLKHQEYMQSPVHHFEEIQLKQIEEQSSMINQSIFSFDISTSNNQQKVKHSNNIIAKQSNQLTQQQKGGIFYNRIRKIIDNDFV